MSHITTHILDVSAGKPAAGVQVELHMLRGHQSTALGIGQTDNDGRLKSLLPSNHVLEAGTYRLKFLTEPYFVKEGKSTFYPFVDIVFEIRSPSEHYHVPLLLSPFGYSTYRGS